MRSIILFSLMCFIPLACSDGGPVGRDQQLGELGEGGAAQTACQAAGGTCVLGGPAELACTKQAPASAQDCDTDPVNPGGASCCLSTSNPDAGAGSLCESAGGQCVLGNVSCADEAPSADQDCNPDKNPGGSFCCLSTSKEDAGGACWPPAASNPDAGSGSGCVPQPTFEICEGSPKKCHDACTAAEYALTCTGTDPGTIPDPPSSLDCKSITIPTPSNQLYYCCPCEK